jgi:hypothetical protein
MQHGGRDDARPARHMTATRARVQRNCNAAKRSVKWCSVLFTTLIAICVATTPVNASLPVSSLFRSICIDVFDLAPGGNSKVREDIAERVSNAVRVNVASVDLDRKVRAEPNCTKYGQPGFGRQLMLWLSAKRQKIKVDGRDWNVIVAGGVSTDGLFQDRELQPVIVLQQDDVSDDRIVEALVEFVDRGVVTVLRMQK